jgi:hypothetical protein
MGMAEHACLLDARSGRRVCCVRWREAVERSWELRAALRCFAPQVHPGRKRRAALRTTMLATCVTAFVRMGRGRHSVGRPTTSCGARRGYPSPCARFSKHPRGGTGCLRRDGVLRHDLREREIEKAIFSVPRVLRPSLYLNRIAPGTSPPGTRSIFRWVLHSAHMVGKIYSRRQR